MGSSFCATSYCLDRFTDGAHTMVRHASWTRSSLTLMISALAICPRGYDWQLGSRSAAMLALESLARHLYGVPSETSSQESWRFDPNTVFVIGHSNGGQGALHCISHFPDRIIGGAVLAGYIKASQASQPVPCRASLMEFGSAIDARLCGFRLGSLSPGGRSCLVWGEKAAR